MRNGKSSYVICILPKAGLGNQLFPLMKAVTFAHTNQLPLKVIGFNQIKIGPYLRREKNKRQYSNYFTLQRNTISELWSKIQFTYFNNLPVDLEPELNSPIDNSVQRIYLFKNIPSWRDYFSDLREKREKVLPLFFSILSEKVKYDLSKLKLPFIGIHVRMGDFRKLTANEDFSKVGNVRTPEEYFIEVIQKIRKVNGKDLPVAVFSDGYAHELRNILLLPNVNLVEGNSDIVDLLLLSKSKVIVASAGSTFSYWAGFLSDAPLILHPDHINQSIRGTNLNNLYEGAFDEGNLTLMNRIKDINTED